LASLHKKYTITIHEDVLNKLKWNN
jgi:hypothetical protein